MGEIPVDPLLTTGSTISIIPKNRGDMLSICGVKVEGYHYSDTTRSHYIYANELKEKLSPLKNIQQLGNN